MILSQDRLKPEAVSEMQENFIIAIDPFVTSVSCGHQIFLLYEICQYSHSIEGGT